MTMLLESIKKSQTCQYRCTAINTCSEQTNCLTSDTLPNARANKPLPRSLTLKIATAKLFETLQNPQHFDSA
jgi:hypothetical protein